MIFVTGQDEVKRLVAKLGKTFPESVQSSTEIDLDAIEPKVETSSKNNITSSENYHDDGDDDEFGEVDFTEDGDDPGEEIVKSSIDLTIPMKPLPLYSVLNPAEQRKLFETLDEGKDTNQVDFLFYTRRLPKCHSKDCERVIPLDHV